MRLGDLDALGRQVFSHTYSVPILETENRALSEVLHMIQNAPTVNPEEFKPLIDKMVELLPRILDNVLPVVIENMTSERRPQGEWIPIKYRPMTMDERKEFAEYYGVEFCDTLEEKVFDCSMPEDGQKILISTSWGVSEDVADNDIGGEGFTNYGLESNGDWDGVDAWMPLPEPYKDGGKHI